MTNRFLGTAALIGAPAMAIGTLIEAAYPHLSDSWFTGLWGLLYITGFMCSIAGLKQSGILGSSIPGKAMPHVLIVTLSIAIISNLILLFAAKTKPSFFMPIDLCWPLSHILMLVVSVLVIRAGKLAGWKRCIPLIMGLWLPFALTMLSVMGRTQTAFFVGGLYNVMIVVLLAMVVHNLPEIDTIGNAQAKFTPVLQ